MRSCLYAGTLRHRRSRPKVHDFRYRLFMFYLDLDELARLDRSVRLFSVNRFNVVSFDDRDHMDRRPGSTKDKVRLFLRSRGVDLPDGKIFLLTSCRILGYVFNPISLYYCHGAAGDLRAVVAEVHNTFGGQHLYLLTEPVEVGGGHPATGTRRYTARKALHVSPFISMDATYEFHLAPAGPRLSVGLVEHEAGAHVLDAQLWGTRIPLTSGSLGRVLLRYPLAAVKTIAAIHLEALKLYLKRVPVHRREAPEVGSRADETRLVDPRHP